MTSEPTPSITPDTSADTIAAYEAILGLRRGGKAVILVTYRGDW